MGWDDAAELLEALQELLASDEYAARVTEADCDGRMALDNVEALRELGVVGLPLSDRFGAAGPALRDSLAVMELLGRHDASSAVAINMNWSGVRALRQLPSFPDATRHLPPSVIVAVRSAAHSPPPRLSSTLAM